MSRLIMRFRVWLLIRRLRRKYGQERLDEFSRALGRVGRVMMTIEAAKPTCAEAAANLHAAFSHLKDETPNTGDQT